MFPHASRNRCSPHTRGWTDLDQRTVVTDTGVPRTRGDGPAAWAAAMMPRACSPHTRGWTECVPGGAELSTVFPAHAGMDRLSSAPAAAAAGVPRTRGDGPISRWESSCGISCSPHTRGWTGHGAVAVESVAVFPAHAGMDRWIGGRSSRRSACSPHTRGWTERAASLAGLVEVFPAHAGMDRLATGSCSARPWCSPHTRGWTDDDPYRVDGFFVFPAHAGMDRR